MVLNGGREPVSVHTRLVDSLGRPMTPTHSAVVPPGASGDATTLPAETIAQYPPGRFPRAESWTTRGDGAMVQRVLSAPIAVHDPAAVATPRLRRTYYSIPAARASPDAVRLRPPIDADGIGGPVPPARELPAGVIPFATIAAQGLIYMIAAVLPRDAIDWDGMPAGAGNS